MLKHKNNSPSVAKRASSGLSKGWWQGIAAIVGVAALVLPVIEFAQDSRSESPNPSPTPSFEPPPASTSEFGNNACGIQGSQVNGNVSISCAPLPRSLAGISFKIGSVLTALYTAKGPPPKPDGFAGYEAGPYCNWWGEWPTAVPDLYLVNPVINLSIESGKEEIVVVHDIHTQIFRRVPFTAIDMALSDTQLINCQIGGGSNAGHVITVNTPRSTVTVSSDEDGDFMLGPERPMPPATLSSKDLDHDSAEIRIRSLDEYLYEGTIRVLARVNGEERILEIGTASNPFRWVNDASDRLEPANATLAWDAEAADWSSDADIYN